MSQSTTSQEEMQPVAGADGEYLSTPLRPSLIGRLLPSLTFYLQFAVSILYFSGQARRGLYSSVTRHKHSLLLLRKLEEVGIRVHVTGLNYLTQIAGPVVIVANHMSTLETVILPGLLQPYKDCTFVVKRSLIEYPFFKDLLNPMQPIVVDRVNPREDLTRVLQDGAEQLAAGRSIIVFPQTTRTVKFDSSRFNSIGVKLARAAGVPIVPLALRTDAWGNGKWLKEFGPVNPALPVHFAFGAPIQVDRRGNAAQQAIVDFITERLATWNIQIVEPPLAMPSPAGSSAA